MNKKPLFYDPMLPQLKYTVFSILKSLGLLMLSSN